MSELCSRVPSDELKEAYMPRNKYVLARRSVWYFLKCALMLVFVATLAVGITITALYISNMYIVVTEGMELRAECILQTDRSWSSQNFYRRLFKAGCAVEL